MGTGNREEKTRVESSQILRHAYKASEQSETNERFPATLVFTYDKSCDVEVAIFMLDIDRFRIINELHGRQAGDLVLIKITERLRTLLGLAT